MDFPDYRYYDRSPNYESHCTYSFNPGSTPTCVNHTAAPALSQYVSISGQISPGRASREEGTSRETIDGATVDVKVINPDKRSDIKLYVLRNVDCGKLSSPTDINKLIFEQLGHNIVPRDLKFDVGYYKGTKHSPL